MKKCDVDSLSSTLALHESASLHLHLILEKRRIWFTKWRRIYPFQGHKKPLIYFFVWKFEIQSSISWISLNMIGRVAKTCRPCRPVGAKFVLPGANFWAKLTMSILLVVLAHINFCHSTQGYKHCKLDHKQCVSSTALMLVKDCYNSSTGAGNNVLLPLVLAPVHNVLIVK